MQGRSSWGFFVLAAGLVLAACRPSANDAATDVQSGNRLCGDMQGVAGMPCHVSAYALASRPAELEGKFVQVSGFYSRGMDRALFLNAESSEHGVIANALLLTQIDAVQLERLDKMDQRYVMLEAQFIATRSTPSEFSQPVAGAMIGELRSPEVITGTAVGMPYPCWTIDRRCPRNQALRTPAEPQAGAR